MTKVKNPSNKFKAIIKKKKRFSKQQKMKLNFRRAAKAYYKKRYEQNKYRKGI